MRLVPYDKKKLNNIGYKPTKNYELLTEFVNSGHECVKLEGWEHSNAYGCMASLSGSIKRYKIGGVQCLVRKGEVYLIKTT